MRAGVLGSPVAHSLSPVLHDAAFAALGLTEWTYERVECDAEALPGWIGTRDASWAGVSVTMPNKHAALRVAGTCTARARAVGAANTLVRAPDGSWAADCTDVDGVAGALLAAGVAEPSDFAAGLSDAVVLGAGGTAAAAVHGLAQVGVEAVTVVAREPARARPVLAVAAELGLSTRALRWDGLGAADLTHARALVSTAPAGAADALADLAAAALPRGAVVLDAVYHPWPTRLATAATARGLPVATGLDLLLHQAFGQVEQFTGRWAPRRAMREALELATGHRLLDPVPRAGPQRGDPLA